MWSDPDETPSVSYEWRESDRGVGFFFSAKAVAKFCQTNDLRLIARSHQLVMEGYKEIFGGSLTTVWSAPNYCYRAGNEAAVLILPDLLKESLQSKQYRIFK